MGEGTTIGVDERHSGRGGCEGPEDGQGDRDASNAKIHNGAEAKNRKVPEGGDDEDDANARASLESNRQQPLGKANLTLSDGKYDHRHDYRMLFIVVEAESQHLSEMLL